MSPSTAVMSPRHNQRVIALLCLALLVLLGKRWLFSKAPTNPHVFFDITVNGSDIGRIIMELRADVVPKTAENFRALATGEKGMSYQGAPFHRIVPGFVCQGGDFLRKDGTGQKSIYGDRFEDENFILKHTGAGLLSMANSGPNTNGCQFSITLTKTDWLDGKFVVFGHVVKGMDVVRQMEKFGTEGGKTTANVIIARSGQL